MKSEIFPRYTCAAHCAEGPNCLPVPMPFALKLGGPLPPILDLAARLSLAVSPLQL